jgi:L-threonylcarbamoyladenylate synthase
MRPTLEDAARALASGDLVVYPTDTLLGLGASALDPAAVERLERVKRRSPGQTLSIALSSAEDVERWADLSTEARAWARRRLPGPYTILVLPSALARRAFGASIVPAGGRLGIRVPDHPVARELARRAGPITATSANLHGQPPSRTPAEARRALGTEVRVYLPATPRPSGRPSTLIDLSGAHPTAVRRS